MKSEELDCLLIDRAAGELAPEVAALLEEHLARDPIAAARAAELHATMQLARAAVSVRAPGSLPPLRVLAPAPVPRVGRAFGGEWLRLAAAIVVGLLAGTGVGLKLRAPERVPAQVAASARAVASEATQERAVPATRFWSASRRTAELLQPAARPAGGAAGLPAPRWLLARAHSISEEKP